MLMSSVAGLTGKYELIFSYLHCSFFLVILLLELKDELIDCFVFICSFHDLQLVAGNCTGRKFNKWAKDEKPFMAG